MRAFFSASLALSTLLFGHVVDSAAVSPPTAAAVIDAQAHRTPRTDLRVSNAKRLAMGRPLRRPKQIRDAQIHANVGLGQNEQPSNSANAQPVANEPLCTNGFIRVDDADEHTLGYIGAALDESGVFGTLVASQSDPKILAICRNIANPNTGYSDILDMSSIGNSTVGYVGAIVGDGYSANLDSPNGDYFYIGLVAQTPAPSNPVADPDSTGNSHDEYTGSKQQYESNVWYTNGGSGDLSVAWRSPYGAITYLEFGQLDNGEFVATPDLLKLQQDGIEIFPVVLVFVEAT